MRARDKGPSVTIQRKITVTNELGLHARPGAEFAKCANRFRSDIALIKDGHRFSAASLIEILRANLNQGDTATLEAVGSDAEAAIAALVQLLSEFRD